MSGNAFLVMAEVWRAELDGVVLQPASAHEDETKARSMAQAIADFDRLTAYVIPVAKFTPTPTTPSDYR